MARRKFAHSSSSPGYVTAARAYRPGRTYAARRAASDRLNVAPPEPDQGVFRGGLGAELKRALPRDDSFDDLAEALANAPAPLTIVWRKPPPTRFELEVLDVRARARRDGGVAVLAPTQPPRGLIQPRTSTSTRLSTASKPAYVSTWV